MVGGAGGEDRLPYKWVKRAWPGGSCGPQVRHLRLRERRPGLHGVPPPSLGAALRRASASPVPCRCPPPSVRLRSGWRLAGCGRLPRAAPWGPGRDLPGPLSPRLGPVPPGAWPSAGINCAFSSLLLLVLPEGELQNGDCLALSAGRCLAACVSFSVNVCGMNA